MARSNNPKAIIISPQAKEDILYILVYLKEYWNQNVVDEFLQKLEIFYTIISINPRLFGFYNKRLNIRKYVLSKQNIIYYRTRQNAVEIISVFSSRQNPEKLKKIVTRL